MKIRTLDDLIEAVEAGYQKLLDKKKYWKQRCNLLHQENVVTSVCVITNKTLELICGRYDYATQEVEKILNCVKNSPQMLDKSKKILLEMAIEMLKFVDECEKRDKERINDFIRVMKEQI